LIADETTSSEEKLLAIGELDRRHVGIACNLGDTVEIGADLHPRQRSGSAFIRLTPTRTRRS
jgi:hypothetical protein